MSKLVTRECPQCHDVKPFREDNKTCGCPKPPVEKVTDKVTKSGRVINVDATRIRNEVELIEALEIDLTKWYVKEFTCRKWEMGYVAKAVSTKTKSPRLKGKDEAGAETVTGGDETSEKTYTPGHEQLFAVAAVFGRVVTEQAVNDYVADNARLLKENRRIKIQLDAEKRYRIKLIESTVPYETIVQQIKDMTAAAVASIPDLPIVSIPQTQPLVKAPVNAGHSEDVVLLLSDTHFGDVIRPGDTSGFPEFDLPVAGNRFGYVIEKVRQILTMHRAMYPIKKLYVWFGGDMGNGDLHDAPASNCLFIGPQVDFSFKILRLGLNELLTLTVPDPVTGLRVVEEIVCLFTCGNHMRESSCEYMPMKYQAQRTFDWLIYQMLISSLADTPRVTIRNGMSPYIFEEIRGHRYLFAHGMQVGYRNSPDMQVKSMDAFLKTVRSLFDSPEFRRKNGLLGPTFARACIGDIHVPVSFPRLVSNGSLNGQNELGVNWGLEPIPAGMQLFGVTEKHIETFKYFVECTQVQKEPSDWNTYGHFAAEYERENGRK